MAFVLRRGYAEHGSDTGIFVAVMSSPHHHLYESYRMVLKILRYGMVSEHLGNLPAQLHLAPGEHHQSAKCQSVDEITFPHLYSVFVTDDANMMLEVVITLRPSQEDRKVTIELSPQERMCDCDAKAAAVGEAERLPAMDVARIALVLRELLSLCCWAEHVEHALGLGCFAGVTEEQWVACDVAVTTISPMRSFENVNVDICDIVNIEKESEIQHRLDPALHYSHLSVSALEKAAVQCLELEKACDRLEDELADLMVLGHTSKGLLSPPG